MCLSGGLVRFVILSSICEVQSGTSCCCMCMLQSWMEGLIVTMRAYISLAGIWLVCCCMYLYRCGNEDVN